MKSHVSKVSIGELTDFIKNGLSVQQTRVVNGLPITRIETIANGVIDKTHVGYAGIKNGEKDDWLLKRGDILISHINSKSHLGKCAIYEGEPKQLIHGMNLLNMRLDQRKAYPRFVYHVLRSPQFIRTIAKITKDSVNQSSFNITSFKELKIPLLQLEEQKRIAAIMDKADAIHRKRQKAIKLADDFIRATFLDMIGSKYETRTIDELINENIITYHKDGNHGGSYPRANEFGNEGIPFISARCFVEKGFIDDTKVPRLKTEKANKLKIGWIEKGDVLLAHNATVGPVFLYEGQYQKALIGTSLTAYRPNIEMMTSPYLFGALKSNYFQQQLIKLMKQSTRNQVPITAQKNLKIYYPPFELQKQYTAVAEKYYLLLRKSDEEQDLGEELFNSLTQRAFRGEL